MFPVWMKALAVEADDARVEIWFAGVQIVVAVVECVVLAIAFAVFGVAGRILGRSRTMGKQWRFGAII